MNDFHFQDIPDFSTDEALDSLNRGVADELLIAVLGVALYHEDQDFAEWYCMRLAGHQNEVVRGNAVLGFGHLARRFRILKSEEIKQLVEFSLTDKSRHVRGQAWAAAEDITHFLGWTIQGFDGT